MTHGGEFPVGIDMIWKAATGGLMASICDEHSEWCYSKTAPKRAGRSEGYCQEMTSLRPRLGALGESARSRAHASLEPTVSSKLRRESSCQRLDDTAQVAMSSATIEQSLSGLLPALNTSLPPELIELALSLLARSRSVAHSLKSNEEIARPYACAQLACER
jgi:hypothetical protein